MTEFTSETFSIFDYIKTKDLDNFLEYVFNEDFGSDGDITTEVIFKSLNKKSTARVVAKDIGVISGVQLFEYIMKKLDSEAIIDVKCNDGSTVAPNDIVLTVSANIIALLKAERICLNFLGRLSGISSITKKFVKEVEVTKCKILDTRKTTPGIRFAEKYAVRIGGGVNHRKGLYDMVLIKDNHIDGASGITACVNKIRDAWGGKYKIIVETRTLDDVKEAIDLGVDRILLDNMSIDLTKKAVNFINGKVPLESSGNIKLPQAKEYALTGVDYISTSYITAWAQPLDLSLQYMK